MSIELEFFGFDESPFDGRTIRSRDTLHNASPEVYSFKWEMQGPDGRWTTVAEGKATTR